MNRVWVVSTLLLCSCVFAPTLFAQTAPAPAVASRPAVTTAAGIVERLLTPGSQIDLWEDLRAAKWSMRTPGTAERLSGQLKRSTNDVQDLEVLYSNDKLRRPTSIKYTRFLAPDAGEEALRGLEADFKAVCDTMDKTLGINSLRSGTGPVFTTPARK